MEKDNSHTPKKNHFYLNDLITENISFFTWSLQNNSRGKTIFYTSYLVLFKRFSGQLSISEHQKHVREVLSDQASPEERAPSCHATLVHFQPSLHWAPVIVICQQSAKNISRRVPWNQVWIWALPVPICDLGQCVYPFWAPLLLHLLRWNIVAICVVCPEQHLLLGEGLLQTMWFLWRLPIKTPLVTEST